MQGSKMETSIEITFLGTGTSIGVPVIGCDCAVCSSDDPKNQRLRSSVHVKTDGAEFIVDTGPDFRMQCLREKIRHLDAVLFTHAHTDHIMGFDDLRRFTVMEDDRIDIFATESCLERLKASFDYVFDGKNHYRGYLKTLPHQIQGPFSVGDVEIEALPVEHGKVETIGFQFTTKNGIRVAYVPDAKIVPEATRELIRGADIFIIDALQPKFHYTHLSIPEAIELAGDIGARETWFTHFSCRVDYKKVEPTLPDGIHLAWDGLKIDA